MLKGLDVSHQRMAATFYEPELCWAAGFFDGEGCTTSGDSYPRIIIAQVDRRCLDRFQAAVGVGVVAGPKPASNPRHSLQYHYRTTAWRDVIVILDKLWPWLGEVKKEQALAVLDAFDAAREENPRLGSRPVRRRGSETCGRGHPASEQRTETRRDGRTYQVCRACARQRHRERKEGAR